MNRLLATLSLCLCTYFANTQTFQKLYGASGIDMFTDMYQLPDQGYLLCGTTSSYGAGAADMYIVRTDGIGNVLWSKTAGFQNNDYFSQLDYNENEGTFIVIGNSSGEFAEANQNIVIAKLDLDGNIIWSKHMDEIRNDVSTSVAVTSDGGFIFSGMTTSYGPSLSDDILIIKGNTDGEVEWSYVYGSDGHDKPMAIIENSNDEFILYAHSDFLSGDFIYNTCIMKFSNDGELLQSNILFGDNDELAWDIFKDEYTGEIFLVGDTKSYGAGGIDGTITKLNDDLSVEWAKTIGSHGSEHILDVKTDIEGNIYISGCTNSAGYGGLDMFMSKFSPDFNIEYSKTYGGQSKDVAYAMDLTPDGGVAIAGYSRSFETSNVLAYFLKTDYRGNSGCNNITVDDDLTIGDMHYDIIQNQTFESISHYLSLADYDLVLLDLSEEGVTECAHGNINPYLSEENFSNGTDDENDNNGGNSWDHLSFDESNTDRHRRNRASLQGRGKFLIEINLNDTPISQVDIYDISGKLLCSRVIQADELNAQIDLSTNYSSGPIYLITYTHVDGSISSEKIVASH